MSMSFVRVSAAEAASPTILVMTLSPRSHVTARRPNHLIPVDFYVHSVMMDEKSGMAHTV